VTSLRPARNRLPLSPLWLVLALPSVWLLWQAGQPAADPDELAKLSGQVAGVLLVVAIGITGAAQLVRVRRAFGLAAFGTSLVHLVLYFKAMGALEPVLAELDAPGIWTGWAALLLLVPLALTSTDAAMRAMGRNWKRLQRLAWPAAGLALVHGWIVHDGQTLAMALAAVLILLQITRFNRGRTLS
jgi:sulfoxide reductase heme-binding subunit YedZ